MATVTRLKLGPADHGRRFGPDEFEAAEYVEGFRYEVIAGRLYVSPQPNPPEHILERWLRRKVERYADDRPEVINFVAVKARVFVSAARPTAPEPDLAAYHAFPLDQPYEDIRWEDVSPVLVAEVLVDATIEKDLGRNPPLYLKVPGIAEYWVLDGSVLPDRPNLIRHRRQRRAWAVDTIAYGETLTTDLLPGFSLLIDPRK